jgi:IS5 family transposase
MRKVYHAQLPLVAESDHPRSAELTTMSKLLDENRAGLKAAYADLLRVRRADAKRGRQGMTAEQTVRAAIVKQMLDVSYDELSFRISDSLQLRAFCRFSPADTTPKKSTLQANIGAIGAETWETINRGLLQSAGARKIEDGRWMRTDTTVVESNIHHPLDSRLLWDGVRVLTRIMRRAHDDYGTTRSNFVRRAKRRSIAILNAGRMERRIPLYRDLLKVTRKTVHAAETALEELPGRGGVVYATQLQHFLPLVKRVIEQTERRVLRGEAVPAEEKLVSLFEPHTDIIRKDRRETYFGHKATISTGRSGLVLDLVIEKGNPADSTLTIRSAERHKKVFGVAPERAAFDGGFASRANHESLKAAGSAEVCFSKPAGVPIDEMTSTPRIRRILKRFRAGIEATISFLKRSFGLSRCTWKGLPHFRAYAWCSTVAHNVLTAARIVIARPIAS